MTTIPLDSPEELITELLYENWTRNDSTIPIPVTFSADNYKDDDAIPGLFVFPLFEVGEPSHFNQRVNVEKPRIRVEYRAQDRFQRYAVKNEIERIILSNNLAPTTTHWSNGSIVNIKYYQTYYKVEDSFGIRHYVQQVDFDCFIQSAY